jgi:AcrR family transcriptional regulator
MPAERTAPSARREQLLEAAYRYVLEHGLADVSLRPLAAAVGSSPRVLLFLFGSKDGLVRALLARARVDELAALSRVREAAGGRPAEAVWDWLVAPGHRPVLVLWLEAYARSLVEPDGAWAGFARQTVDDWLGVLGVEDEDPVARTATLALLRGALLDLLATGDAERTTAAVRRHLDGVARWRKPAPSDSAQGRKSIESPNSCQR